MNPLFKVMASKVRSLMIHEARLTNDMKKCQQWQLLFQIDGIQFIVGKGDINTMFYVVADEDRVICYPDELIEKIWEWSRRKYTSYYVFTGKKEKVSGPLWHRPKDTDYPVGSLIVGRNSDGKKRLAVLQKSLAGKSWLPI